MTLIDNIRVPRLSLPHGQIIGNLAQALDKSMSDVPAFNASVSMRKPKLLDAPMDVLPFHEQAHELDTNLNLFGKDTTELRRHVVHEESLLQLDSSFRKALCHTSLMEQTIRTINVLSEGTDPLDHVSI